MSGGDGARGCVIECCWPGVTEQAVADAAHRTVQAAAEIRRQAHDVDFLTAILVPPDETIFCLFEGHEAAVRTAGDRAGIPAERVLESVRVDGNPCQTQLQALINSVAAGCPLHLYMHD
jgi:Protein of unknown function (DUF4242)